MLKVGDQVLVIWNHLQAFGQTTDIVSIHNAKSLEQFTYGVRLDIEGWDPKSIFYLDERELVLIPKHATPDQIECIKKIYGKF